MELLKWGDGTIRLSFWDAVSGNDAIFVLGEGGQAWRAETEYESPADLAGKERLIECDLVQELRGLALALHERTGGDDE